MTSTDMHDVLRESLEIRREELATHVDRCERALRGLDTCAVGMAVARDLVESRSRLAQVRHELRRLQDGRARRSALGAAGQGREVERPQDVPGAS